MEIIVGILIVLYLIFFCFPAFMITWEGSVFEGIGCYGWLTMIIGYPGWIFALILKLIFVYPKKWKAKRRSLQKEREKEIKKREQNRHREEQKQQCIKVANKLAEDMFKTAKNQPYNYIQITTREIIACQKTEKTIFYLKDYGLSDLPVYWGWWVGKYSSEESEDYFDLMKEFVKALQNFIRINYHIDYSASPHQEALKPLETSDGETMYRYKNPYYEMKLLH
ncbi:MAG: hypothetical protein KBS52_01805 [Clostridiales bacterium]|nr:hypothetical protein [Candidatus Equinaster intestinalis]